MIDLIIDVNWNWELYIPVDVRLYDKQLNLMLVLL
jgi:hypothetical protein